MYYTIKNTETLVEFEVEQSIDERVYAVLTKKCEFGNDTFYQFIKANGVKVEGAFIEWDNADYSKFVDKEHYDEELNWILGEFYFEIATRFKTRRKKRGF